MTQCPKQDSNLHLTTSCHSMLPQLICSLSPQSLFSLRVARFNRYCLDKLLWSRLSLYHIEILANRDVLLNESISFCEGGRKYYLLKSVIDCFFYQYLHCFHTNISISTQVSPVQSLHDYEKVATYSTISSFFRRCAVDEG